MFPRRMSLLEVRISCRLVSSSMSQCYLEDVAVLGECCPYGRDSSLNLLVLVFFWCYISVPGRYTFQRSSSECC